MNSFVTLVYIIFHFNYIYSTKECPTLSQDIPRQRRSVVELAIELADRDQLTFSNRLLDLFEDKFSICRNTTNPLGDESNKDKSYLVDYEGAKVFTKNKEIDIFYPLTRTVTNRCPFSRFFTVILKCPATTVYSKKALFIGKEECDLNFLVFDKQACFVDFTIEIDDDQFKNLTLHDLKISMAIIYCFAAFSILFGFGSLVVLIVHVYTDYVHHSEELDDIEKVRMLDGSDESYGSIKPRSRHLTEPETEPIQP